MNFPWSHFLGHSPSSPELDRFLEDNRIFTRPHTAEEDEVWEDEDRDEDESEEDYQWRKQDEAERNADDSLIDTDERSSLCLIYDTALNYERLYGPAASDGAFVLKQVAVYAKGVQGLPGYTGELPFGLSFQLDQAGVHRVLGTPTATRIVHELKADLYIRDDFVVNVSYLDEGARIGIIHVRRPHVFDLRLLGKRETVVNPKAVSLPKLIECIGRTAYDDELESLLEPMGWQSGDFDMSDCDEVPDLIERYGIALYYRPVADFTALRFKGLDRDATVFAGFRVNRLGDMGSLGYDGALPFELQFHDTLEQVVAKVGRTPDATLNSDDIGSYRWKLPQCVLHVMYSLIDYQVYRVSCFGKFMEEELFRRTGLVKTNEPLIQEDWANS